MKCTLATLVLLAFGTTALADPIPKKELVESNKLRRVLTRSSLLEGGNLLQSWAFATPERNRGFGGTAHKQTVDHIYNEAVKYGYNVYKQEFTSVYTATTRAVGSVDGVKLALGSFRGSPSTNGPLTAPLVVVNAPGCTTADFADSSAGQLAGKILLIPRGVCSFVEKVQLAHSVGASAVLVVNTDDTPTTSRLTPGPGLVPAAGISSSLGKEILSKLASGRGVTATLDLQYLTESRVTHNVIAQTKDGDPNNVVMIGAHTDSVPEGPGINDDGSGTLAILEIMKQLSNFSVNNAIRFSWWSAEEFGLLGSNYFVEHLTPEEYSKIKLYINLDMIASPNYVYGVTDGDGSEMTGLGAPGSAAVEKVFQDYFSVEVVKPYIELEIELGSTDYSAFISANIPFGDIYTGSSEIKTQEQAALFGGTAGIPLDPNYHKAGDTVDNCNVGAWIENTKAAAHIIALSARSLDYMKPPGCKATKRGRIPEGYLGKAMSKRGVFGPGMGRASCGHSDEEI